MNLKSKIRNIADYPKKGINFKDITTLISDPAAFNHVIDIFYERLKNKNIDKIVGIESRGFIFGSALAYKMKKGFIPIRKKGKLPAKTIKMSYELEYGSDEIEIHEDSLKKNERVVLVDDLIATGGTALASIKLLNKMNVIICDNIFLVDLCFLGGSDNIKKLGLECFSICIYEDE